jgi:hypothetical protein
MLPRDANSSCAGRRMAPKKSIFFFWWCCCCCPEYPKHSSKIWALIVKHLSATTLVVDLVFFILRSACQVLFWKRRRKRIWRVSRPIEHCLVQKLEFGIGGGFAERWQLQQQQW